MNRKALENRRKKRSQRWLWLGCLFMMLCLAFGCSAPSLGSIEQEDLDLTQLSALIDEHIASGAWQMEVLQDPISEDHCDDIYGIQADLYQEVLIRRSLIDASCEEIVVFHCVEGRQKEVVDRLKAYQERRKAEYEALPYQNTLIQQGEVVETGNYVFFVCSQDVANMIQYISSLA